MFFSIWKQLAAGKTLMRAFMNRELRSYSLASGIVLDLGGGRNPSYRNFIQGAAGADIRVIDKQYGSGLDADIDFECDVLPFKDETIDQVLLLNVLEHIYHYAFFLGEVRRILKPDATVLGFVPFLINYHPDPSDYFRYTDEALEKILAEAGFKNVTVRWVGLGPFSVNANTLASFLPRAFVVIFWPLYYILDRILISIKPGMRRRFPLGYLFTASQ